MLKSPWTAMVALWLAMFLTATATGDYPAAWFALACTGLAVLSAITERLQERQVRLLHATNRILATQVRLYEKDQL